jgi:hypothetical protein
LFTRLKRYVYAALVALALCAATLVALPAPAQAQAASTDGARGADASPARGVVVHSGDNLWSISQRLLPANATPQQIYTVTARIYALNREQIGPDPNQIFAGQRLSVPPALSGPPASEPSASGRSAGTGPPARKAAAAREAAEAASAGDKAGRQASRGTVGTPRRASKPAYLPDAAQAAPVPAAGQNATEEPPRSPGEFFVGEMRAAIAGATSAVVGLFPSEGYEGYTWRELLGAALLAVSSVAAVLTVVITLLLAPGRARRSQRGGWWREVHANERANEHVYERAPGEGLEGGTTGTHAHANGAHANGAHANGARANGARANGIVPVGMILTAERKRGRLRRRGRPRSPARHVRRHVRRGLAHSAYSPGIRHLLRGASGTRPRRTASCASASSRGRLTAEAGRTGVRGR